MLVPSNSLHLPSASNVSWLYSITVLGDTVLLFHQCYETSNQYCLKSLIPSASLVQLCLCFKHSRYRLWIFLGYSSSE